MNLRRLICIICLLLCVLSAAGCGTQHTSGTPEAIQPSVYLLLGFDEAASNTDVVCLVSVDRIRHEAMLLQLPRDTYLDAGQAASRLNAIFATEKQRGAADEQALIAVRRAIERALGVGIDATVGVTLSVLRDTVDLLGGVDITLTRDMSFGSEDGGEPLVLSAGEHHLNGALSERFVRHRKSYARADLDRVDAQKVFLSALLRTVRTSAGPGELVRLATTVAPRVKTDVRPMQLVSELCRLYPTLGSLSVTMATLPGDAVRTDDGRWYYIANRPATEQLLTHYFGVDARTVDPDRSLLRAGDVAAENVYFDTSITYRLYTDGS